MLLVIDNYDSFTYNIVQILGSLGEEILVIRNDERSCNEIARLAPRHIVLSPGPGTPRESGISMEVLRCFAGRVPILGICLGHQAIGEVYGGKVIRSSTPRHGKTTQINHNNRSPLFEGIPPLFKATQYNSLLIDRDTPHIVQLSLCNTDPMNL